MQKQWQLCVVCLKGKEKCIITTSVSISNISNLFLRHRVKATLLKLEHEPYINSYSSKSIVWRGNRKEIHLKSSWIIPDYVKKLWLAYWNTTHFRKIRSGFRLWWMFTEKRYSLRCVGVYCMCHTGTSLGLWFKGRSFQK